MEIFKLFIMEQERLYMNLRIVLQVKETINLAADFISLQISCKPKSIKLQAYPERKS